ncbi:hypothetical protein KAFR_0C02550 [Kazachstania africana CBS 2517]|uniref:Required for respiratory growth protein 1, mitochondrial n=1 Tax=Kazachstania africana (strain ATCC 22294 / BCRC 22015 / CBS 2517 / CECT 1963 / NBRC 1671 / NRRL Y-8276) TaxID=1071382 RepID=H2AS98_KAZAF|nr:hypothetical protein KAFR_0C02550 [Kazachstania africana CBS 2517]CCF57248.1 hypothetical protein KAFR_0C02550 [Kazachstania africana CBS 2517]
MVSNFSRLSSHRHYVLRLYRCTLRLLRRNCHSILLQSNIRNKIKAVLKDNRNNKSSWNVLALLKKLEELNGHLFEHNFKIMSELVRVSSVIEPSESSKILNLLESSTKTKVQTPEETKQMGILSKYITSKQASGHLPNTIPGEYKRGLLLPLALHEFSQRKIKRIEQQLDKGIPKVYLSYTKAGSSKIWFVRAPFNKGRRQSKGLSAFIKYEREKNQKSIDSIAYCENMAKWAFYEAVWEHAIENGGKILPFSLYNMLNNIKLDKPHEDNSALKVYEWFFPLKTVINRLGQKNNLTTKCFERYKQRLIMKDGRMDFFTKKTAKMYKNRKARFDAMSKAVPYAFIYHDKYNLPSILDKHKF